jgi:SAM-dependent methyltransferase
VELKRIVANLRALRGGRDLLRQLERAQQGTDVQATRVIQPLIDRYYCGGQLPSPELRARVGVNHSALNFWAKGVSSSQKVIEVFGTEPDMPVLDWGCGSGRTLMWLRGYPAWREHYYGCDVDGDAVAWLRAQGEERVTRSSEAPPLPYVDGFFGGVFAISILTHVPPERHRAWYAELTRVLAPGGRVLVTTDSVFSADGASNAQRDAFAEEGHAFLETRKLYGGATWVSEAFTRRAIDGLLEIESYEPGGYTGQDVLIARRAD